MAEESDFQLQNSLQAILYARETIRTAGALNGGAAIAIIGFIGGKDIIPSPALVQDGLWWFCLGLIWAFCASIVGYIAQTLFAMNNYNRQRGKKRGAWRATCATWLGVILVVASGSSFFRGIYLVSGAIFGSELQ